MSRDSLCVECTLHNDPRLLPGIGAVVMHAVRLAGLPEQDQDRVAALLTGVCEKALRGRDDTAGEIKVSAGDYSDRVEVKVESLMGSSAANSLGNSPNGIGAVLDQAVADRVKCEVRDGYLWLTLTKCKGVAKAGANS
jgi:hypothetical protein